MYLAAEAERTRGPWNSGARTSGSVAVLRARKRARPSARGSRPCSRQGSARRSNTASLCFGDKCAPPAATASPPRHRQLVALLPPLPPKQTSRRWQRPEYAVHGWHSPCTRRSRHFAGSEQNGARVWAAPAHDLRQRIRRRVVQQRVVRRCAQHAAQRAEQRQCAQARLLRHRVVHDRREHQPQVALRAAPRPALACRLGEGRPAAPVHRQASAVRAGPRRQCCRCLQ